MSSSATGVGMPICFLGAILLILTQKSSQKFGDVLGIFYKNSSWGDIQLRHDSPSANISVFYQNKE